MPPARVQRRDAGEGVRLGHRGRDHLVGVDGRHQRIATQGLQPDCVDLQRDRRDPAEGRHEVVAACRQRRDDRGPGGADGSDAGRGPVAGRRCRTTRSRAPAPGRPSCLPESLRSTDDATWSPWRRRPCRRRLPELRPARDRCRTACAMSGTPAITRARGETDWEQRTDLHRRPSGCGLPSRALPRGGRGQVLARAQRTIQRGATPTSRSSARRRRPGRARHPAARSTVHARSVTHLEGAPWRSTSTQVLRL